MMRMFYELKEPLVFSFISARPDKQKSEKQKKEEEEYEKQRQEELKKVDFGPTRDWMK